MKVRDSGMPEETQWNEFFNFDFLLSELNIRPKPEQIVSWFDKQRFQIDKQPFIIEPYHFGLIISKN